MEMSNSSLHISYLLMARIQITNSWKSAWNFVVMIPVLCSPSIYIYVYHNLNTLNVFS